MLFEIGHTIYKKKYKTLLEKYGIWEIFGTHFYSGVDRKSIIFNLSV